MTNAFPEHGFYGELAEWWPLISPPEEYTEEAAFFATLFASAPIPVHEVLELGSGGGHNAFHLKSSYRMTLTDLSLPMLAVSSKLNPECEHVQGDMRNLRVGRLFDAVFVHDAVAYMTSESDLRQVIETAFVHCRPGGVALFVPDDTSESFVAGSDCGGYDDPDGRGARYLEWSHAPEEGSNSSLTDYSFLLREADGAVRVFHETHRLGLFSRQLWLQLIEEAGFSAVAVPESTTEDRSPREMFLGTKPLSTRANRGAAAPSVSRPDLGEPPGSRPLTQT
jgi:SAM-dependent methyltransferase